MLQISVAEASENLAQFVDAALTGEEVVIIKDNLPVVKLTKRDPDRVCKARSPTR